VANTHLTPLRMQLRAFYKRRITIAHSGCIGSRGYVIKSGIKKRNESKMKLEGKS